MSDRAGRFAVLASGFAENQDAFPTRLAPGLPRL